MAIISEKFDLLGRDDPTKTYRLGIMGGTFDPIHIGHLACAEQVADTCELDGVIFMPAGDPWMKQGRAVTSADHRFNMVAKAIAGNDRFCVSRLEINRPGNTYTIDTLRTLREHFPNNVDLDFISGADALFHILKWRNPAEVAQLAHLVAATRPGYELSDTRKRYMRTHANIFRIIPAEITALSISSSDIRERVRNKKSIRYLVPREVFAYIHEHKIYTISHE